MSDQRPQGNSIRKLEFKAKLEKKLSSDKVQLVMLAYQLSKYGHKGQTRDSGDRYFEHPKRVALILMDGLNIYEPEVIISALLHDIKEDSFILEWENIEFIFGKKVLEIVKILTKEESEKDKSYQSYLRKIRKAERTARIIKLADRLDNLKELYWCPLEKQARILQETEKYYLPLAKRTNKYLYEKMKEMCESYKNRII